MQPVELVNNITHARVCEVLINAPQPGQVLIEVLFLLDE